jgi:reductive dehalogenase
MSIFHSTVNRRDFMKALGFMSVGVGAASVLTPNFHDLDEVASSGASIGKRPWWVKEVENPTIDIDYSMMQRYDGRNQAQNPYTRAIYLGLDRVQKGSGYGPYANTTAVTKGLGSVLQTPGNIALGAGIAANAPGLTYRSRALVNGFVRPALNSSWVAPATNATGGFTWGTSAALTTWGGQSVTSFLGSYVLTPTQRGEPQWTGTPEEASALLFGAMRIYGVPTARSAALTQEDRDHVIFSYAKDNANSANWLTNWPPPEHYYVQPTGNAGARPIVYENVDLAYEADNKLVIPQKQLWHVGMNTLGASDLWRGATSPGIYGGLANANTFYMTATMHASTWSFLRYLGYQMIGTIGNDARYVGAEGSACIKTGVSEASRQKLYCLSPENGNNGRQYAWLTDLPLAENKPIDAGMYRFCHSCHKCADHCPSSSISQEKQPSYDIPSFNGIPYNFTVKGTKAFYLNTVTCQQFTTEAGGCLQCWGWCTFTVNHGAIAHQIVKPTIANSSFMNGFFYKMGEWFGYGDSAERAEKVLDLNLPAGDWDTTSVSTDGGYNKVW